MVVSEGPELYRKLREVCRKNCPQVSFRSALVTPSYHTNKDLKGVLFCPYDRTRKQLLPSPTCAMDEELRKKPTEKQTLTDRQKQ